jgi:flavin reductase (DIM6/NTAB) family NADH-FMN oxidoreductase RutF
MPPDRIEPAVFRHVLSHFPSGVAVITVRDASGIDHGMTVSAFCSLSLQPPLVLTCIGHDATIAGAVAAADSFGVSVLAAEQEELSRRFAEPYDDRFEGVKVERAALGVALIDGALAQLECAVRARHEAGDHTIVVGEVISAHARDGRPLVYFRGEYGRLAP